MSGLLATAEVEIAAPVENVWAALTDPRAIKQYMFGSDVTTTWKPGDPITWAGDYEGTHFEDKGEVLVVVPNDHLVVTHYSPMSGQPDIPENYHRLDYRLHHTATGTALTLTQDGNGSAEEAERASQNWAAMLAELKSFVE